MFSKIKSILFNTNINELRLKEKELKLKEKELELKDKEITLRSHFYYRNNEIANDNTSETKKRKKKFDEEEKKSYVAKMKEAKQKGEEYEKFIAGHFKLEGYDIYLNGIKKSYKDKGIDIICSKDEEVILIQCKNWKRNSKYKIKHNHLKEFIGNCTAYANENNILEKDIKLKFITSNYILDSCAKKYIEGNNLLQYEVIEFK